MGRPRRRGLSPLPVVALLASLVAAFAAPVASSSAASSSRPSVVSRGLVSAGAVAASDVLREHARHAFPVEPKRGDVPPTLGYVTPWNAGGMEVAVTFARKLDLVAPVWYVLKMESPGGDPSKGVRVLLDGAHNADEAWARRVRDAGAAADGHRVRVVPRFAVEVSHAHLVKLAGSSGLQRKVVQTVRDEVERRGYDGAVLEMTGAWYVVQHFKPRRRAKLNAFVRAMADAMHEAGGRALVLVVPPRNPGRPTAFGAADAAALEPDVDYFSLMTYDYSSAASPGPSSPVEWARASVLALLAEVPAARRGAARAKVLMGLNWYGQDFDVSHKRGRALVAHEYLEILEGRVAAGGAAELAWDDEVAEHSLEFGAFSAAGEQERHLVYYPTLASVSRRVRVADELGAGLSIWELGQGLLYFHDLL